MIRNGDEARVAIAFKAAKNRLSGLFCQEYYADGSSKAVCSAISFISTAVERESKHENMKKSYMPVFVIRLPLELPTYYHPVVWSPFGRIPPP